MNFQQRFATAIENKGITKAELARRVAEIAETKVRGQQINDWLRGTYKPSGANLTAICYVLNIMSEWLLTGQGEMVQSSATDNPKVEEGYMDYQKIVEELAESTDPKDQELVKDFDHIMAKIRRRHKGLGDNLRGMQKKA